jgi:hypothetical protein
VTCPSYKQAFEAVGTLQALLAAAVHFCSAAPAWRQLGTRGGAMIAAWHYADWGRHLMAACCNHAITLSRYHHAWYGTVLHTDIKRSLLALHCHTSQCGTAWRPGGGADGMVCAVLRRMYVLACVETGAGGDAANGDTCMDGTLHRC